jgi:hypothetical protein
MVTRDEARAAKSALLGALASVRGVCGVGLTQRGGESDWVLRVNVETVSARKDVPPVIQGVPVQVQVVGPVTAR